MIFFKNSNYNIVKRVVKLFKSVAYHNYNDFQHINFIFSQIFISLFWGLFNDETDLYSSIVWGRKRLLGEGGDGEGGMLFLFFRISHTLCSSSFLEWFGRKSSSSSTTHPSCAVVMHASSTSRRRRRRRRRKNSNYHAPNTKGTVLDDIRASLPFPSLLPFPSYHEFPKIATTQTYLNKTRTRTRIQQSFFFLLTQNPLCI